MLDITRIDHIGMVVPSLAPQLALLEGLFGFRTTERWDGSGSVGARLEVPGGTGVAWELLAPAGEGGPLAAFIEGPTGPGIHHVAVEVPDLGAAGDELRAAGIEPRAGDGVLTVPADGGGNGLSFRVGTAETVSACGGERGASAEEGGDGPALGIVGIDHVCHAYRDRDELGGWYARVFGMRETHRTPPGEHEDLADLVMDVPGGQMRWEVLQPVGDGSFVQRFLDGRGPSVHHVAFEVGDWDRAVAACEHHGLAFFDESRGETEGARWRDAFIHPRDTGGVLVQCFWEERPDAWVASDKVPSGPAAD